MTAFTETELNDLLAESATYASDASASTETAFRIDTDEKANWYLRKLANIEAEKARVTEQAEKILSQLQADADRLTFMFGSQLETYARMKMQENGGKRRSVSWLQGTVSFRSVAASWRITDTSAALAYAKQHAPELVSTTTTERLKAQDYTTAALARLDATGELLPGVDSTPAHETVKISFGR